MITYDGKHVFVDIPNTWIETLLDMAADLSVYCYKNNIELIPRGVAVRDNDDDTFTLKYGIRSM